MYNTGSSGRRKLFKPGTLRLKTTIKTAFILATVIDAEVAKTEAGFLIF